MGGAFALDYGAVMLMAQAQGVDTALLADVLPDIEREIIAALRNEDDGDDSGDQG